MPSEEAAQLIMFKYAKTKAEKEREEHIEERKSRLKSLTCKDCHKVLSSTLGKKRHEQQVHVRNLKKLLDPIGSQ